MGTGGSNPPFSAKKEDDAESSFFSGYGAVRLAHLLWEQGVEGSNPFAPTVERKKESLTPFSVFVHLSRRSMTSFNLYLFPVDFPMASMNCWS